MYIFMTTLLSPSPQERLWHRREGDKIEAEKKMPTLMQRSRQIVLSK